MLIKQLWGGCFGFDSHHPLHPCLAYNMALRCKSEHACNPLPGQNSVHSRPEATTNVDPTQEGAGRFCGGPLGSARHQG